VSLLGWALPLGLATGLAAWLLAGGASAGFEQLEGAESQLMRLKPPVAPRGDEAGAADLLTTPLFALTTGPGAIREPSLRVDGLSVSRRRMAALVSIDGKPAAWLTAGETADGVTLQAVTAAGASFETALGAKTVNLGEQTAASAPDPHAPGPAPPAVTDQPPPGFHGPSEPANAPPRR
jgi:hypothetical protein